MSSVARQGIRRRAIMDSLLPGKPPRAAVRLISSPSYRNTSADHAPNRRIALSAMASKTGCTSVCAWLMTRRISAVAVCLSSDSVRSVLRAWSSVSRRAFLTAITAWSAKVWSSAISAAENPPGSARETAMTPRTSSPLSMGTARLNASPGAGHSRVTTVPQDGIRLDVDDVTAGPVVSCGPSDVPSVGGLGVQAAMTLAGSRQTAARGHQVTSSPS